jgi:YD repeat-containing protein
LGGGRGYTWNTANQPSSSTGPDGMVETYLYDPDGARVARTRNGVTTVYLGGLVAVQKRSNATAWAVTPFAFSPRRIS